jgi:serine/threonine protein kinase/Tol biopolymer transport system component
MNPERWRKLDQLFHATLERDPDERTAFVVEACEGDDELRRELESMIAHHEQAQDFIEQPAFQAAAETLADDYPHSLVGKPFGPYQIVGELGSGGMGVVYLAFDQELGRKIALKFLRLHLTEDKARVGRFKQEARAASALNHPNILTVYQIGELEGRQFIATEFVEGVTLRELMKRGPMNPRDVLDVATQIASALSVAHAAGIVHRDIKPENIMLRPDGFVKVLDFGVAKLTGTSMSDSDALTLINTEQGTIVGTVQYMSPEQVRGLSVDALTDVWSLGVVLYEMVTGSTPFTGATRSDVIAAILEREPSPLTSHVEGSSDGLQGIVTKALTKNREQRYQTARGLMTDLHRLKQRFEIEEDTESAVGLDVELGKRTTAPVRETAEVHPTSSAEYVVTEIKQHKKAAVIVLATLAIAVAGIVFWFYRTAVRNRPAGHFQTISMTKLSSARARGAAISPDGKYVAYVRGDGEQRSIWLRQVGTTSDILISPQTDAGWITFSPDGTHLYWTNFFRELYRMPVLGGARSLVMKGSSSISFSPDAKRFAFVRNDYPRQGESSLMAANLDGSGEERIASLNEPESFTTGPAWSPDGKVIACAASNKNAGTEYKSLIEVQVENGARRSITSQKWDDVNDLAWLSDGSGLLVLATDQNLFAQKIWQLSYPSGEVRRVTNDFDSYDGLSLTANSAMLVTMQEGQAAYIWLAPDGEADGAKQITSRAGKYLGVSWTPDGKLVYASDASGNWDIWIMGPEGGDGKQLTVNAKANLLPSVSSDGRYVVFTSNRSGSANIWRMDVDGGNPKQITNGNFDYGSSCSPNGNWVVYVHESSSLPTLWKISIDGGQPVQLTDKQSGNPVFSPDGKLIAFSYGNGKVAVMPSEGGQPTKVFDIPTPFILEPGAQWSADGRSLIFHVKRDGISNLWSQPLDGGSPNQVTDFKADEIFSFAWSRNGKQLALARGVETGDVVLISDSR